MPLEGMIPYPPMPQFAGQGPVPPPGMAPPPASGPDASKIIMAFLQNLSPDEQKGAVYGIGMRELLRSMDLKSKQRLGADGQAGASQPAMKPGGGLGQGGNMAAPLAPMNSPLGMR